MLVSSLLHQMFYLKNQVKHNDVYMESEKYFHIFIFSLETEKEHIKRGV